MKSFFTTALSFGRDQKKSATNCLVPFSGWNFVSERRGRGETKKKKKKFCLLNF